jgi:hypothetical protein
LPADFEDFEGLAARLDAACEEGAAKKMKAAIRRAVRRRERNFGVIGTLPCLKTGLKWLRPDAELQKGGRRADLSNL